uniref:Uncharacterized protein n=1 Tax=Cacopsylla melanoneura TaxID=428564 RepID=A0A8D8ZBR7_9HEMI
MNSKMYKIITLVSFLYVISSIVACGDQHLGSKHIEQNTIIKRHLPTNSNHILKKSLDRFARRFESIKSMPWDYKYRRHTNKIDWDLPDNLEATWKNNMQRKRYSEPKERKIQHESSEDMVRHYVQKIRPNQHGKQLRKSENKENKSRSVPYDDETKTTQDTE